MGAGIRLPAPRFERAGRPGATAPCFAKPYPPAVGNEVGGDLEFVRNTGSAIISLNTIAGALRCRGNDPAPFSAGNVFAEALGQCAA